jgi:NAD-dependent deacetylase
MADAIERVVGMIEDARRVLAITGAGVSADSGLPTYRGIGGLYDRDTTEDGIPIEVAVSGLMFHERPELTWKYIHRIEKISRGATYNRAHRVLADMEETLAEVWVLTQNVDGLHRQAGSRNVIDIHGDVHELICSECDYGERVVDFSELEALPHCPACGAVVRPDVVLFGELLPPAKVALMRRELSKGFDLVLSIGTTSVFPYIAGPVVEAAAQRIPTVEINPGDTEVSDIVDVKLPLRAAEACDAIWQRYQAKR